MVLILIVSQSFRHFNKGTCFPNTTLFIAVFSGLPPPILKLRSIPAPSLPNPAAKIHKIPQPTNKTPHIFFSPQKKSFQSPTTPLLTPQPSTVNCQLSTVNRQLSTVNPQPSTANSQLSPALLPQTSRPFPHYPREPYGTNLTLPPPYDMHNHLPLHFSQKPTKNRQFVGHTKKNPYICHRN